MCKAKDHILEKNEGLLYTKVKLLFQQYNAASSCSGFGDGANL